jgi:hypothetical protein
MNWKYKYVCFARQLGVCYNDRKTDILVIELLEVLV